MRRQVTGAGAAKTTLRLAQPWLPTDSRRALQSTAGMITSTRTRPVGVAPGAQAGIGVGTAVGECA
jgi:hypothetical protein